MFVTFQYIKLTIIRKEVGGIQVGGIWSYQLPAQQQPQTGNLNQSNL